METAFETQTYDTLLSAEQEGRYGLACNCLFQTSTMSALIDGIYDGRLTVGELLEQGDFGLGTFNALDGEMIIDRCKAYRLSAAGDASAVKPNRQTPFACVTRFVPDAQHTLDTRLDKPSFEGVVDGIVRNPNLLLAVRIEGTFERVFTRTVSCQSRPYRPMLEAVAAQATRKLENVRGVMLGFRTPEFMHGLNVGGWHLHFMTEDRTQGGHVIDYVVTQGQLEYALISDVEIHLPRTPDFARADLSSERVASAIRRAES
ncbi:acetolactate decarboxylase [Paraburkholderia sp. XV]|uniref:acetolactate decarboxylase n=1 Tax=Paraburkholderia sp. XV TaxID=2831520 RepID=UPI001CD21724|nr:acetolactate decarboxylase [Paraburkholderia sp. XV]